MTLPLRTYSAGMRMRLAFAIATVGTPDILLIDEVLAAGDSLFQQRAKDRISRLLSRSKIIVLSSHSGAIIREFCTTCLYLDAGKVRAYGETEGDYEPLRSGPQGTAYCLHTTGTHSKNHRMTKSGVFQIPTNL